MNNHFSEQEIEDVTIEILEQDLGYEYKFGAQISLGGEFQERDNNKEVVLRNRLEKAIYKFNKDLPNEAKDDAIKKILRLGSINVIPANEQFHKYLVEGIPVEYKSKERVKGANVKLFDFDDYKNNDFLVVNQFTVETKNKSNRRPDVLIFVNGLPLVLIELKNPTDENATIDSAYKQIQTYIEDIPQIFYYNELTIIADGLNTKIGAFTSSFEWYSSWKLQNKKVNELESIVGLFDKKVLLNYIKDYIFFKSNKKKTEKIIAAYHQYYATEDAVKDTIKAVKGNKKVGVVWHTTGSGKSYTMAFYSGKIIKESELKNPTLVVINDRNDLDDQLYKTFCSCSKLLKTEPVQINNKKELKEKLKVSSGGVFFTTMQKFNTDEQEFELLSNRDNIVVIADEAHRTQYGFKGQLKETGKLKFGFAKYLRDALPNASFIGFTGTPIDVNDKSTRTIFGNYIDIYDIQQAVDDKRTVKIYYESRLAKLGLKVDKKLVDVDFDNVTEDEEETNKELYKSKWATLEAVVGSKDRIKKIAKDIVSHFEQRNKATDGKAMVVCMSRRICVDLYDEIKKLKPSWANKDDKKGLMKVVMTGAATDGPEWQEHIRGKKERSELADIFKDPESEFKLAIVRDMWLTGFDVPSLNTLYIDKPMKGHGLMQAIARVNRVFKEKTGGLIVDYLGIAVDLKDALSIYSASGGKGKPTYEISDAIRVMMENYNIIVDMFYKFDYKRFYSGTARQRLDVIAGAMDHILALPDGKKRFIDKTLSLSKSYALAVPSDESKEIANDVAFFIAIKNTLIKKSEFKRKSTFDLDKAINQIISKAIASEDVMDIFDVAGMKKPEISILSEEFLQEIRGMKYKNLALETLQRLLHDEIKAIFRHNNIKYRQFSEMLEEALRKYYNRSIDSAKVIEELIKLAKEIKKDVDQNKDLGLSQEEIAFYDALANDQSAKEILGDDVLREIARELTNLVKKNTSVDWSIRESVQANLRLLIKRLLAKYGYPPSKRQMATDLVLDQAKLFADEWNK